MKKLNRFLCWMMGATAVILGMGKAPAMASAPAQPGQAPEGRLLRFPDIHDDFVAFVYAGDIWRAPVSGGPAYRLTSHVGQELFPKISPDGKLIAFTAEYSGSRQVWVMDTWGGTPRQLTFYNDVGPMPPRGGYDYWIQGWSQDGKILVRMNRTPWGDRNGRYFLVDPKGGLETPLPIHNGGSASLSPDGGSLAYTPIDREFRTWKRTMGGRAQDIWTYDFRANRSERLTDWRGTDNFPLWADKDTLYFTSDRERTLNLFSMDLRTRAVKKVTDFKEYDVLWPSLGGKAIVFMNGGGLWKLDLESGKYGQIPVQVPGVLDARMPSFRQVARNIDGACVSPSGARVAFAARGELFTVPGKEGITRNLSDTPRYREMSPAWSPDGKNLAYLSDATGEYELYIRPADGSGAPRQLSRGGDTWLFGPSWSPDGKWIAFGDRKQRLRLLEVATGSVVDVDKGRFDMLDNWQWSPDSRWLVYSSTHETTRLPGLALYSLEQKKVFPLDDGLAPDFEPAFSADGRYLFFASNRDYNLTFSAFEFDYLYNRATRIFVASLDPSAPALFPARNDEEKVAEAKAAEVKGGEGKAADVKPVLSLQPAGFAERVVALPGLAPGVYGSLSAAEGALYYVKSSVEGPGALFRYDLKERKEEKVLDGVSSYQLTPDGRKLLYHAGPNWGVADARPGLRPDEGRMDLSGLRLKVDPVQEYQQIFDDGWRVFRDWFYDPAMHGTDWKALKARYQALLPFVGHRSELDWLMGEMVGELEAGHTYVTSGEEPRAERVGGGMLGCEFAADVSGRYRIAHIFRGENWDDDFRSPLTEPGVNIREGEYLLAVNGVDLTTSDNPFRLLEGKAGTIVSLTVNSRPALDGARTVLARPIASELNLRYIDWVKTRMDLVEKLSGGRVGYIHLPDTAQEGNRMLQKLFYSQCAKPALIVDDRYNGGGFIPVRMIEYLSRTTQAWWARRGMESMRSPQFAHDGPKAMLINGYSSSGGDCLPYLFRKNRLGTLIGTRTWGGLIGLSGDPRFVDGGGVETPTFRIYDQKGQWVVENEGVSPDIEVVDLPERLLDGGDPSVEKAVEILLHQLVVPGAFREPAAPAPPDMAHPKGN